MKKIISLCLFINITFSVYSQDTVYVQGYYVQKFLKNEILFQGQNQVLREQRKSFKVMIDFKTQLFFFPLQINSNISLWEKDLIGEVLQSNHDYKNTEIFYFPPFSKSLRSHFDKSGIMIQQTEFPAQCSYYVNEKDSVYVYRLYYVEGNALRIKIDNDYLNTQRDINLAVKWGLDPTLIKRNIPSFYAYLFYKCDTIQCNLPPEGFTEWRPDY